MARKENRVAKLRKDVDKLRKSYTGAMSSANQAVQDGFERLAEHELNAIKTHYEAAIKNLKDLRKGGDPRDIATAQLKLLQETIDRIMSNARDSLAILDETRKRISDDVRKELDATSSATSTSTKKKPAARKKPAAKKTTAAKKPAAKKTTAKKAAPRKTASTSKTAARSSTAKSGTAAKASSTTRKAPAKRRTAASKPAAKKTTSTRKTAAAKSSTTGSDTQS